MSFKKQDEVTAIAEREISGALGQAQNGAEPSVKNEEIDRQVSNLDKMLDNHLKSLKGELPQRP